MVRKRWSGFQGLGYTFKRFPQISIAFTVGHSITLLLGSLQIIGFSEQWIEVLLAGSILISDVNLCAPYISLRRKCL